MIVETRRRSLLISPDGTMAEVERMSVVSALMYACSEIIVVLG